MLGIGTGSIVTEIREAFGSELDAGQQSALISWLSFTGTFGGVRGVTHAIRDGKGPFRNLSVGGEHLYHYMWGIGLLAGVGAVAVKGEEQLRRHPATSLAYGVGLAPIMDEFVRGQRARITAARASSARYVGESRSGEADG